MSADLFLEDRTFFAIEAALVGLAIVLALAWPAKRTVPLGILETLVGRLRGRPWTHALLVAALAIGLRAALLPILGPPAMFGVDEFSFLLQAETFAAGRLANPTHPLFPFFESIYVNQQPAYASMYFPGRGVPMLAGILLANWPWLGVWLSMVLLAVATGWMLRAYLSEMMALLGAVLVVIRFGVLSTLINTHHGTGFIALGGVLVLGAFPRLMRAPRWREGILMGLGLLILMTTRPYEGLAFSLPFLAVGAWKVLTALGARRYAIAARMALPTILITGAGAGLILAHYAATTGDALTDPYTLNRETYAYVSPFWFEEHARPTELHAQQVDRFFEIEAETVPPSFVTLTWDKIKRAFNFWIGPVFLIPILLGFWAARRVPLLYASGFLLALSFLFISWPWPLYLAPGFGLIWILIMLGLAGLRERRFAGRPSGLVLARLLPVIALVSLAIPVAALVAGGQGGAPFFVRPCCAVQTETPRSRIERRLLATPGDDLVIYRFDPARDQPDTTIVANGPSIDSQEIVWAHDLGPDTQRLIDYYPDRLVWLVDGFTTDLAVPIDRYRARRTLGRAADGTTGPERGGPAAAGPSTRPGKRSDDP